MDWIYSLGNFKLAALLVFGGITLSTVLPALVRRRLKFEPFKVTSGVEEAFKVLVSVSLLLIVFSLVRVQGDHRNAEDLAAREAALIFKLNRALVGFGSAQAVELQSDLKAYAQSVVQDEWPLLVKGERAPHTSELLADLTQGIRLLDPKNAVQQIARAEVLGSLTQLSDVREARIAASHLSIPAYLWNTIVCAVLALTLVGALLSPAEKMVTWVGGVTVALGLLISLLLSLQYVYRGESRVSAEPIALTVSLLGP